MLEAFTAFDAIALAVVIISAIMAFARGFMREIATLGAFIAAAAAAYFAQKFFTESVRAMMPEGTADWLAPIILVGAAFLIVYIIVAWLGQRVSKNIHGLDGIGIIDHIAGLAFGTLRGVAALVFFALVLNLGMEENKVPGFIQEASVYPYLQSAAQSISRNGEKVAKDMVEALPSDAETGQ
jgi:membrane protein required for colicin V production